MNLVVIVSSSSPAADAVPQTLTITAGDCAPSSHSCCSLSGDEVRKPDVKFAVVGEASSFVWVSTDDCSSLLALLFPIFLIILITQF